MSVSGTSSGTIRAAIRVSSGLSASIAATTVIRRTVSPSSRVPVTENRSSMASMSAVHRLIESPVGVRSWYSAGRTSRWPNRRSRSVARVCCAIEAAAYP
jgi:hypothetical protein